MKGGLQLKSFIRFYFRLIPFHLGFVVAGDWAWAVSFALAICLARMAIDKVLPQANFALESQDF